MILFGLGYRIISIDYEKGTGDNSFLYDVNTFGVTLRPGMNLKMYVFRSYKAITCCHCCAFGNLFFYETDLIKASTNLFSCSLFHCTCQALPSIWSSNIKLNILSVG